MGSKPTQLDKCKAFAALHQQSTAFVIPNPFDTGSARILENLGFKALATTSAGLAQTLGRSDGQVTLEEKLAHCRLIAAATSIPVNVDFEDGYARDLKGVADNVLAIAETGVAGCSIEDFNRETKALISFNEAVDRVHAAVEAVSGLDMPFQLTARAENLLRGVSDLDDTILRLQAFEAAGANVLYAPGLKTLDEIRTVASEVSKPLNVLSVFFRNTNLADFENAGANRISVGSALAMLSMGPLIKAGREMLDEGTFKWGAEIPPDLFQLLSGE